MPPTRAYPWEYDLIEELEAFGAVALDAAMRIAGSHNALWHAIRRMHAQGAIEVWSITPPVWRSLVQGGTSPVGNPGNINADPLFTNPAAGDYTLQPGSPAIDAASNAFVPSGIALDFAGLPRFIDDPATPNTGVGPSPVADMGAHEFQPQNLCRPDFTTSATPGAPGFGEPDGVVNDEDFFYYLFLFSSAAHGADMTATAVPGSPGYAVPSGVINNDDFFYYLTIFVAGC